MRLSILHTTSYRYAQPVGFNPHRLMLRPRGGPHLKGLAHDLRFNQAADLCWAQDLFGNQVATARFPDQASFGRGDEADRRFVRVLAAVLTDGLDAVDDAVQEALDAGAASDDLIITILARRREPPAPAPITTSETLALRHPPVADCARYDQLRGSRAAA